MSLVVPTGAAVMFPLGSDAAPDKDWVALRDVELTSAKPGNALDFSSIASSGPAGQAGWARAVPGGIGFERSPTPVKFFCASMVFSPPNGGLPAKDDARRLASELRKAGYNVARLHFIDAHLMEGRTKDFDFDPGRMDRLFYLLSQLKAAGIFWIVDGMTSNNGAYGDVGPNRYVSKHHAKLDALVSDEGFDHWTRLVDGIWGAKNPYTGSTSLADPALLGMILINEGGVAFNATVGGGRYPDALAVPFAAWLRRRYGRDASLRDAWAGNVKEGETIDRSMTPPATLRGQGARDKDFARFIVDLESAASDRMQAHVRQRGFQGLTTAVDNSWGFLSADVARSHAPWVDMHAYHTEPSKYVDAGSKIAQTSLLDDTARAVRDLSSARQWGKPFTVSEYGQPFWNRYRYEMATLVPAMAAHQGWSMVCQFAEVPLQFDYGPSPFPRRQAIYPFGIGADPIAHAAERLGVLLFRRGDVASSNHRIRVHVNVEAILNRSGGWERMPEALSRLALVAPIGLDFGAVPSSATAGEISIDLGAGPPPWLGRLQSALSRAGVAAGADALDALRAAGIIDASNKSRPGAQQYESDTHQIVFDAGSRLISIDTPRTAVVIQSSGSGSAGALRVEQAAGPALFAVSSLDGRAIGESRRLLVWVLTDAMNSGMTFSDTERTTLARLGTFPPLVRTLAFRLAITNSAAASLKAWALALNGDRRESVAVQADAGAARLTVDTGALPGGPALYFELAAE